MQNFKAEGSFEIEYQVVDGGELDITFEVFDPTGKRIISDVRQEDGLHNIDTNKGGDFQICLDNRFSRMTPKVRTGLMIQSEFMVFKIYLRRSFLKSFLILMITMTMNTKGSRKMTMKPTPSQVTNSQSLQILGTSIKFFRIEKFFVKNQNESW